LQNDFAAVNDLEVSHEPGMPLIAPNQKKKKEKTFTIFCTHLCTTNICILYKMLAESDPLRAALHRTELARGKCYVICYNPNHDLTMAELTPDEILPIITAWYLSPPAPFTIALSTFSFLKKSALFLPRRIELYSKIKREYPFIKYIQM
jgi:hypothetical protein